MFKVINYLIQLLFEVVHICWTLFLLVLILCVYRAHWYHPRSQCKLVRWAFLWLSQPSYDALPFRIISFNLNGTSRFKLYWIRYIYDSFILILVYTEKCFCLLVQDARDPETLANLVVCCLHLGKPSSKSFRWIWEHFFRQLLVSDFSTGTGVLNINKPLKIPKIHKYLMNNWANPLCFVLHSVRASSNWDILL